MKKKKKVYCENCGTVIKDGEESCPVCHTHITYEKDEDEEEEEFELEAKVPFVNILMIAFIFVGIVLTIKGVVEFQNAEYCRYEDCGLKSLFIAGIGIVLMISAGVALARSGKVYKKK